MFSITVKRALILAVAMVALAVVVGQVAANQDCRKVNGRVTIQVVDPMTCDSDIDLCAVTTFTGDLRGTSAFTGTSFTGNRDSGATSVFLITGDNVIQTRNGILTTKDAIVSKATGNGEFAEVDVVVAGEGTGEWAGASGTLTASGTFLNGFGEGRYEGEICWG